MAFLEIPLPLRWTDLDGYMHVNNNAFLRLLEEARIQAFWAPSAEEQELGATAMPTAISEIAPDGTLHTFVASHRIEYLQQLGYRRDGVIVKLWISKLSNASLDIDYELVTREDMDAPYIKARTVVVLVDRETRRPTRITESLRAAIEPYMGEPVTFRER